MDDDLGPLRAAEPSDLRTDGYSRPQLRISFHFSVAEWEGGKAKEMIISPHGSFLRMKGITYELYFFPLEANEIFNEVKIGHFKTKKNL